MIDDVKPIAARRSPLAVCRLSIVDCRLSRLSIADCQFFD